MRTLLWLVGWLGCTAVGVVAQGVRFEHVTVEDGLSNSMVYAILEDSRGYLWVGTRQGLNRYDGYGVKVYRHISGDTTSLSGEHVTGLVEAHDGSLWVGTAHGVLNHFDPLTGTFTPYPLPTGGAEIWRVHQGRDGMLWLGPWGDEILRFDPGTGAFTSYRYSVDMPDILDQASLGFIHEARDGALWIGSTAGGLHRFDPTTDAGKAYRHRQGDPTSLSDDRVSAMYEGQDGTLWVGTMGGGLNRFDPRTETFSAYRHREGDPTSLSSDRIKAIAEGPDHTLWVGTWDDGVLHHFDPSPDSPAQAGGRRGPGSPRLRSGQAGGAPATGAPGSNPAQAFTPYRHRDGDPSSLSRGYIWTVYTGRGGTTWVGKVGGGLIRVVPQPDTFAIYRSREGDSASLAYDDIRALHAGRNGVLWVGVSEGLSRLERPGDRSHTLSLIRDSWTDAVLEARDGMLWFGGSNSGLTGYDSISGRFVQYQPRVGEPASFSGEDVWALAEARDGSIWVGTNRGLNHFDPATGTFSSYRHRPDDTSSLSHDLVRTLLLDNEGTLWVGTNEGLNGLDGSARAEAASGDGPAFRRYEHRAGDPTGLSHNRIFALHEGSDGSLWVGVGNGLNRIRRSDEKVEHFTARTTNLDGSAVFGILEDDEGMLWLGLYSGRIARFNPETGHARFFGPREGIDVGGFLSAAARMPDGTMYFGGRTGLVAFHPEEIPFDRELPRLYLNEFKLFNEVITPGPASPLRAPLSEAREVVLTHRQNEISFGFVGIDLSDPRGTRYDYRLIPYDDDWRGVTEERRATYTALPPGAYTFEVKAANSDGVWTEPVTLDVVIRPPWWRTWWAYGFYGLLFLAGVFGVDRVQRHRLIRRERERAHAALEAAHTELQETHAHLKTTQQQLVQQEKMASLGQLTAGIAHEIKNPLNFVNNFAELNEELADELLEVARNGGDFEAVADDLKQNARVIAQHGRRADAIVRAMMQHASGGTGQRESVDLNALVAEYIDLAYHGKRAQVADFDAEISRDLDEDVGQVKIVPQEIGRVLLNLLSNAFDALQDADDPTVTVSTRRTDDHVEIRVSDNGPGIPEDIRERVFEPFFTTKPTGSGTGLGLSLAYDIVTQGHGGTLTVESEEGEGATFVIALPA